MSPVRAPALDDNWSASTGSRVVLAGLCLVLALAVATGGSARPDILGVMFIRIGAVLAIAMLLLATPAGQLRRTLPFARFALLAVALIAVQLVPLPPAVWRLLPGHASYAAMAEAAVGPVWRPLTMTPDLTVNALLALVPSIAVALCAALQSRALRGPMLIALILCALGSALLGLIQLAAGDGTPLRWYPITNDNSAVGIFANRNHHAVLLASTMPAVAAAARISIMRLRRGQATRPFGFGTIVACAALAAMAVATGSRFGIVAATIGALGALAIYRAGRSSEHLPALGARGKAIAAIAALAVVGTGGLLVALPGSGLRRIFSEGVGDDSRAAWLAPLYDMAMAFMPFGSGFGSFDSVYRGFEPFELLRPTYLNAAHNDLAQIAIEGGVGALALLALYLWWWGRTTLGLWTIAARTPAAFAGRAASVMTGVMMLGSLVDYPLRTPLLGCIFAIASVWMAQARDDI